MSDYIEKQLDMCTYADLSNYDEKTNSYFIKKYSKLKFDLGSSYLVQIANEIYNQPNSIYAINWNNGGYPKSKYMKIYITKVTGKMVYINGRDYDCENKLDLDSLWSGWIPIDGMKQIEKLGEN